MKKHFWGLALCFFFSCASLYAQISNGLTNVISGAHLTQSSSTHNHTHQGDGAIPWRCRRFYEDTIGTTVESSPWWQVDLGENVQLESLSMAFSNETHPEGFKSFYVLLSAYPMEFTDLESHLASQAVEHVFVSEYSKSNEIIPLGKRTARYVRVQSSIPTNFLFTNVSLLGTKGLREIAGNGIDDDFDGKKDQEDKDLYPVFRSVMAVPSTCPTCQDGYIQVVAGGEDLSISLNGGEQFQAMSGEVVHLAAGSGNYNLVLASQNGTSTTYQQNPVTVGQTASSMVACFGGDFGNGLVAPWVGQQGQHTPQGIVWANNTMVAPRQAIIRSGPAVDPFEPMIPLSAPSGEAQFARLGNTAIANDNAQSLTFTFVVTPATVNFTFWYAAVAWLHGPQDPIQDEAFFSWNISVTATGQVINTRTFNPRNNTMSVGGVNLGNTRMFIPWTCQSLNLTGFIGQQVTVNFQTAGCAYSGHGGYAYIDGFYHGITPAQIAVSSNTCLTNVNIVNNGCGYNQYFWTVEQVTTNGVPIPGTLATGPTQIGVPVRFTDVIGFWRGLTGRQPVCDGLYKVTLNLIGAGDCTILTQSVSQTFQYLCLNTLEYCDMAVCRNAGNWLQTQGTGTCNNCTFSWSPSSNLNNPQAAFPMVANPAGVATSYNVTITRPDGCTTVQPFEVWDAALDGTLSSVVKCVDKCNVRIEAYFTTSKTLNTDRVKVSAAATSTGNNLSFSFTSVITLPNGNKRYTFTSSAFENKGAVPNDAIPEVFNITISTIVPQGFCTYGECSTLSTSISVPRGIFHGIPNVYVPNVFTPNAQNPANRIFHPSFSTGSPAPGVYWVEMKIFYRWGGLVYENTLELNPTCATTQGLVGNEPGFPWNGYVNNDNTIINGPNQCPMDVYTYVIKYRNCKTTFMISGDVALLW